VLIILIEILNPKAKMENELGARLRLTHWSFESCMVKYPGD